MPKATKGSAIGVNELLTSFYKAKLTAELANADLEEKKTAVTNFLKTQPDYKYSLPVSDKEVGFSLRVTPVYQFSKKVEEMEVEAKQITVKIGEVKKKEVETGEAKVIDSRYAVYVK